MKEKPVVIDASLVRHLITSQFPQWKNFLSIQLQPVRMIILPNLLSQLVLE